MDCVAAVHIIICLKEVSYVVCEYEKKIMNAFIPNCITLYLKSFSFTESMEKLIEVQIR